MTAADRWAVLGMRFAFAFAMALPLALALKKA
jgi:hypothetical protein